MNNHRYTAGNVHVVAIIVAVIVVLGGLGFVLWRQLTPNLASSTEITNFEDCKKQAGSVKQEIYPERCITADGKTFTGPSDLLPPQNFLSYCATGERICFEYPDNWVIQQLEPTSTEPGFEGDRFTVSDPTGSMNLWFTSGIGGIGGICEPDGTTTYVLEGSPVAGLTGFKTDFEQSTDQVSVARVITQENNLFRSNLYISNQSDFITPGELTEYGGVCFSQILDGRNATMSNEFDGVGSMTFNNGGTFSDFNSYSSYNTLADAKESFTTKLFIEATNILLSLKYS